MSRFDQDCWICDVESSIWMNSGSSAPSGSTTTVQNTSPWAGQIPYLTGTGQTPGTLYSSGNQGSPGAAGQPLDGIPGVMPSAASLYENYSPSYYPGTTYSPETDQQSSAISGTENLGLNGSPITGASNSAAMNILNPNFLNSNPGNSYYNGVLSGNSPSINAAVANVEPGIMDQFTGGGAVTPGSGASYGVGQGVGNAIAGQMNNAAAGLANNYNTAAGQQNTANLIAPSTQGMAYTDLSNAYGAGSTQQGLNQNTINDAISRYNYNQTQPLNMLDWYSGLTTGSTGGGTSTLTSPYFTQSSGGGLTGGLSGAASGAALGSAAGPYGTAGGAILGGLLGAFSDRRLKKDIRRIGTHHRLNLPIYEFRYKWEAASRPLHVGVMAQEALAVIPQAVYRMGEYLAVDYAHIWGLN
jgi:Chaperone of endosialidase